MPPAALTAWFQIVLGLGGAWFALFIIWPSIRRQSRLGDRIDTLIDKAHKKLDAGVGGKPATIDEFIKSGPEDSVL